MADSTKDQTDFSDPEEGVNRLFGMVVEEVSLVDRAANKRTFLVVKKDTSMATTPTKKDDNASQPAMPGGSTSPAPEKLAPMQAQVKDALLSALTAASEKLVSLAQSVKETEVTDQQASPAVPDSVTAQIGEIASMLAGLSQQFGGGDGAGKAAQPGTAATPAKGAALDGVSENGGQDQQGTQKADEETVAKVLQVFKAHEAGLRGGQEITLKAGEVLLMGKALGIVHKAGRKMAKERLGRFHKAMDLLAGILKELTTENVKKAAGAPSTVVMKAAEAAELFAAVDTMSDALASKDATIGQLRGEVATLKKAVRPGNSSEAPGDTTRPTSGDVSWPMDLNHPISPKSSATDFGKPKAAGAR